MLSELHPHIVQAYENAQAVTHMQHETESLHDALDFLGSAVVCLSSRSTISWATPHAEQLLSSYNLTAHRTHDRLHRTITDWFNAQEKKLTSPSDLPQALHPLVRSGAKGALTIRLVRQGPFRLLILDETRTTVSGQGLNQFGLSPRETEILSWIAQGKTNPEIGTILGISPRTVQKHLERVYGRLGVENRHAAMTMAMEAMQRGRVGNDYN